MQLYMKSSFKGKKINTVVDPDHNLFFPVGLWITVMEAEMKSQGWKTKHEGNGYYYQLNADMSHFPSETESIKT